MWDYEADGHPWWPLTLAWANTKSGGNDSAQPIVKVWWKS